MVATVWSKDGCPPCAAAMEMLAERGIAFSALKLGEDFSREDFIKKFGEGALVPQIFLDGKHVGGATELRKILSS